MGVYLYDRFGNLNLLYRDPDISSNNPIPVKARPTPPVIASSIAWSGRQEGAMLVQDIYQGLTGPQGESVARGTVKALRVIGVPPKVQPHMNNPNLGVSSEDPGKFLLGSVPVEKDGSAYFRVPSGIPLFFQALDAEGLAIQTMRSLTYVGPQQTLACVGCHERRETAPPIDRGLPLALRRGPSRLQAGPQGSWPLRFDRLVQPVLDKSCTSCHRPGSGDVQAARFDLTAARSYDNLLAYADGDLKRLAFEKDRSLVNDCPARQSKLLALLRNGQGHKGVRLDADSINRLATWMDLYAHRQGHFSPQQEKELHALQEQLRPLLAP
jgi:hypothetical protein